MTNPGEQSPQAPPLSAEVEARIRELQALITESHLKADKAEDEDIREALNLQISKLGLKVARLRRGQPEDLPIEVEKAVEEEFEPLPQPTPEELHEADLLIQRAMLEKRRGNNQASSDLMKKAAEVAPGAASVLEAVGDDLLERRQYGAALEAYRSAHRADPSNVGIERKFASLSSKGMANLSIEDQLRMGTSDSIFIQRGESIGNPKLAIALSIMIPGSGQFVMGASKKGATIFFVWLVSLVLFGVMATFIKHEPKTIPLVSLFPAAVAVVTWLAGVADASSMAKGSGGRPQPPNRPPPPVNLPFE